MKKAFEVPRQYSVGTRLCEEPVLYVMEDFATAAEMDAVRIAAEAGLQRARVSLGDGGNESTGRTGRNCWVALDENKLISGLSGRIADLVGIPLANAESLQVIHYDATQQYAPHFDAWKHDSEAGQRCMKRGGQRLVTGLLYLNTVAAGGGTVFPKLDLTLEPRAGRLVIFNNCHAGSNERHPHSLHGGMPVLSGEKWACNFWFRERPFNRSTGRRRD